jgi:hypothetical protein
MRISPKRRETILTIALILLFIGGAIGNIGGVGGVSQDYARWGYPPGFRYLTGVLELTAVALLLRRRTRWVGALLGTGLMAGALATLLYHREMLHALIPAAGLALSLALLLLTLQKRRLT